MVLRQLFLSIYFLSAVLTQEATAIILIYSITSMGYVPSHASY